MAQANRPITSMPSHDNAVVHCVRCGGRDLKKLARCHGGPKLSFKRLMTGLPLCIAPTQPTGSLHRIPNVSLSLLHYQPWRFLHRCKLFRLARSPRPTRLSSSSTICAPFRPSSSRVSRSTCCHSSSATLLSTRTRSESSFGPILSRGTRAQPCCTNRRLL